MLFRVPNALRNTRKDFAKRNHARTFIVKMNVLKQLDVNSWSQVTYATPIPKSPATLTRITMIAPTIDVIGILTQIRPQPAKRW